MFRIQLLNKGNNQYNLTTNVIDLAVSSFEYDFMIFSILATIGRIVTGLIADLLRVNRLVFQGVMMVMAGLFTAFMPWLSSFPLIMAYSIVYGMLFGKFCVFFCFLYLYNKVWKYRNLYQILYKLTTLKRKKI